MNIQVALQNTIARCNGLTVQSITQQGTLWTIRLEMPEERLLEFEIDEIVCCPCVIQRKNLGYNSLSRFMTALIEEIENLEEDDDPIPPARD